MAMTIGYNFRNFLQTLDDRSQADDMIDSFISWLFEKVSSTDHSQKVVTLQALDTLQSLQDQPLFNTKIEESLDYLVKQLSSSLSTHSSGLFIQYLEQFSEQYYTHFTL
mmetsp:Transcript_30524/g.46791  ORF Transcript_30524/g.46791 Transcript_30524/m.46791 type:complete len:109 (-) Transcript_30524:1898-2224(-)